MATALITGANRGIGLELTKQLLEQGWDVQACCRDPKSASDLQALQNEHLTLHALDVCDEAQIHALKKTLGDAPIDLLINNAGIAGVSGVTLENFTIDNMQKVFLTNSFSPLKILQVFTDNVAASDKKIVANISSRMGSISDNTSGRSYAYRSSKSALNQLMTSATIELANKGVKVLILHPGWVRTDMGGNDALVSASESVTGMLTVIFDEQTKSGGFYNYRGEIVPW